MTDQYVQGVASTASGEITVGFDGKNQLVAVAAPGGTVAVATALDATVQATNTALAGVAKDATVAKDGTDSTDANATQATAGVGLRGWASTLVSLFRAGTAKVSIRLLTSADVVTTVKLYTPIQTESTTNTRTATGGTTVYQTVIVPITLPAGFYPSELGLAGTLGPLTFATNGTPAGSVTLNLEHQDASGRWNGIWNSGAITANAGTASYPTGSIGAGLSSNVCFTNTLRWNYVFTGTFTTASLTEQMTLWGK